MPLFGGNKRPALGGLTKDEQKRLDALSEETLRRAVSSERKAQDAALLDVLQEQSTSQPQEFLWPLIIGWQLTNGRRFTAAIDSFNEALSRDGKQVRSYCGAGRAYLQAGMAEQSQGAGVTAEQVPPGMSIEALYQEAGRCYTSAIGLTRDASELVQLREASDNVEKALARTVKRN